MGRVCAATWDFAFGLSLATMITGDFSVDDFGMDLGGTSVEEESAIARGNVRRTDRGRTRGGKRLPQRRKALRKYKK